MKKIVPIMVERLEAIMTFKKFKAAIDAKRKNAAEINPMKFKEFVLFSDKTASKFFSLLLILNKSDSGPSEMRMHRQTFEDYLSLISAERPEEEGTDEYKLFNEIYTKLKTITKTLQ